MAKIRKIYDQTIKPDGSKTTIYPITSTRAVFAPDGTRLDKVLANLHVDLPYIALDSASDLPPEENHNGYLIGKNLYVWVGAGGDTLDGKYQNCGPFKGPKGDEYPPDEEDLTRVNVDGTDVLKFKDKAYDPLTYSGMGRKILRKNIVEGVNTLTQSMMQDTNTIYIIQYDFTLGENITVPENCVLEFKGGSISGGHIFTNDTIILGSYESSISCISGEFITDKYIKDFGLSTSFNTFSIVKNGEELVTALTSNDDNKCIFLRGDIFVIPSETTITCGGRVIPYPGYKPQIIGCNQIITSFDTDINNEDYVISSSSVVISRQRFFELFNEEGENINIQKLSDIIGETPTALGGINKTDDVIRIIMSPAVKAVMSNKTKEELSSSILILNAGWTTITYSELYSDDTYIYATPWQWASYTDMWNYEYSQYSIGAAYEIFNLPFYGGERAFIDKDLKIHISRKNAEKIYLARLERVFKFTNSNVLFSFHDITFKGSGNDDFFKCESSSHKHFINCKFEYISGCFYSDSLTNEDIIFDGCIFENTYSGALNIRGTNCIVKNCKFNKIGLLIKQGNPISFLGYNNSIINNYICDFGYCGIYTGGGTTVDNSGLIQHNIIEQNEFRKNPRGRVLRDGGGIYVGKRNLGLVVKENIIRHLTCAPSGNLTTDIRGIFLDDGAWGVEVNGNIIFDIPSYAIDSREVTLYTDANKGNIFTKNIIYGSSRFAGNANSTEQEKIIVDNNYIASEFKCVTNQYVQQNNVNYFVAMKEIKDILHINYINLMSNFENNTWIFDNVPYKLSSNKIRFAISKETTNYVNIYCPTIPNKKANLNDSGIIKIKYKIAVSFEYEEYSDYNIELNVSFHTKTGKPVSIDPISYDINANRSRIEEITTQSISDYLINNKGFLLNLKILGDKYVTAIYTISIESIFTDYGRSLPCSTYLLYEEVNAPQEISILKIPLKRGDNDNKPLAPMVGYCYFNTDLGKPIWWDGSNWVDATGATV